MSQDENADNSALGQYEWWVEGVLMGIVGVLGIVGNVSAIGIFWARFAKKPGRQEPCNCRLLRHFFRTHLPPSDDGLVSL